MLPSEATWSDIPWSQTVGDTSDPMMELPASVLAVLAACVRMISQSAVAQELSLGCSLKPSKRLENCSNS